jgi:hypothetical protein
VGAGVEYEIEISRALRVTISRTKFLYVGESCNAPNFGLFSALCRMHDLLIFYCMDLILCLYCLTALSGAGIR